MEKQCTVMPVTETFMVKHVLEITRLSAVKRKTQFANRLRHRFNPKSQHKYKYSKCVTCKKYLPNDHECFIQPYKFLDEIVYDNAGQDAGQRLQKVVTLLGTLRLLLLINKVVRCGKFHIYWLQRRHVIIASIDPLKSKFFATRVKDTIKPESVFQMKPGKLTTCMSKCLVGQTI